MCESTNKTSVPFRFRLSNRMYTCKKKVVCVCVCGCFRRIDLRESTSEGEGDASCVFLLSLPFVRAQSIRPLCISISWRKMAASAVLTLSPKAIGPFLTLVFFSRRRLFDILPFFASMASFAYLPFASCAHVGSRFTSCRTHGSQDLVLSCAERALIEEYRHNCVHPVMWRAVVPLPFCLYHLPN